MQAHADIRRRLFDHERHRDRNIVSVMFEEGARKAKLKDDGVQRGQEKMPEWRGLTIFYQGTPGFDVSNVMFVDSWEGLIPVHLTYHDMQNFADVFETWSKCAMMSHMKPTS